MFVFGGSDKQCDRPAQQIRGKSSKGRSFQVYGLHDWRLCNKNCERWPTQKTAKLKRRKGKAIKDRLRFDQQTFGWKDKQVASKSDSKSNKSCWR